MEKEIVLLPKEKWKDYILPIGTVSDTYYDMEIVPLDSEGCTVRLVKKPAVPRIVHTPDEWGYPDKLYQEYRENAEAYGVISEDGRDPLACIEISTEEWSNRLIVSKLWITAELRGQGLGKRLMDIAKKMAKEQGRRAIILETQSCNTNAIGFYLHQGFELVGFDTCCYTNDDINRREVRINLGYIM
ncbi:MAG: GNAT family N-acetyltransferase [Ruminococcus sp.]|uniref:GNAT family N-acetyltransferase n=1 Tax=Ruminococcus sp. TaxID=41978 RepID=UPI0025EE2FB9|nr:GNAT family N-acetyltransferase [Ruminococcus sp.]MBO4866996.1 GNAT family N-acetyltransferase [Ruminococcus sp.]